MHNVLVLRLQSRSGNIIARDGKSTAASRLWLRLTSRGVKRSRCRVAQQFVVAEGQRLTVARCHSGRVVGYVCVGNTKDALVCCGRASRI